MSRRLVQQLTGQASAFAKQGSLRFTTSAQCLQAAEPAPDIVSTAPRPGESRPAVSDVHRGPTGPIEVPSRLLMGPGPANVSPRVMAAHTLPLLGHMHPPFFRIMDEIQQGLRYVFQTDSPYTLLVSGTGHAGMEACIANLIEPGDKIVVGNKGIWGARVTDLASRYGAEVIDLQTPPATAFSYEALEQAVTEHKPAVLFLCQGESSTGVHQNLAGLGDLCRANGTLLLVDTVCTLGGVPLHADDWGIDAIYSGSQKVLGAPPGCAPLFFSERAFQKLRNRKTPVASYYFDLNLVGDYWGWFNKRFYHHTGMVSNWYGVREALAMTADEGLDHLWQRHGNCAQMLWGGLSSMGLEPLVQTEPERLATVNTIKVPEGVDWAAVNANAMSKYSVEIAGGLGGTVGKCWRVGIMGYNATPANVELVLAAFRDGLRQQGRL